jgi:hypothetical protein
MPCAPLRFIVLKQWSVRIEVALIDRQVRMAVGARHRAHYTDEESDGQ